VASTNTNTSFILGLTANTAKFNTIMGMNVATGSCAKSSAVGALTSAIGNITAVLAIQRNILNTIDIKLKQPIPYCDVYYSTTGTPTTTTTTTTGTRTTTKTTTTTMTTTTYGLLTIPVCLNRPVVSNSSANSSTGSSVAPGRRRRDVELYEAPRRYKRAIMTVCDPRQVFGVQIMALDVDHFQVISSQP